MKIECVGKFIHTTQVHDSDLEVTDRHSPDEIDAIVVRLQAAAAKAREARAPQWVDVDGVEWATDGTVVIRRGIEAPKAWDERTVSVSSAQDGIRALLAGVTNQPHKGAFDPIYADLLRLGTVTVASGAAAVTRDGVVVAFVSPLDLRGVENDRTIQAVRADGSPWVREVVP